MGRPVRAKTAPGTPLRQPLTESVNNGNSTSSSPSPSTDDDLHDSLKGQSPPSFARPMTRNLLPRKHTFDSFSAGTSSPLKRSDTIFSLDQASLASPVAKRRSIHGAYASADFKIFDESPTEKSQFGPTIDRFAAEKLEVSTLDGSPLDGTPSVPERSSSLRLSTLQQRHLERPSFIKSRPGAPEVAFEFTAPGFSASQIRSRNLLDNPVPASRRETPFSSHGQLASASMHAFNPYHRPQILSISQAIQHPHPLSRTMIASSQSSTDLDSPTHPPLRSTARPLRIDFSKSLPIGATRPAAVSTLGSQTDSQTGADSQSSYMTPQSYKFAKPLPAAFMSTGLISKKNRDIASPEHDSTLPRTSMPDTPCKRPTGSFPDAPADVPEFIPAGRGAEVRHSFGTPSTPYNPNTKNYTPQTFGKGVSIFGSNYLQNRLNRSESFTSIDALEAGASPPSLDPSQSFPEHELPPTPTKPTLPVPAKEERPFYNIFGQRSPEHQPEVVSGFTTWPIRSNTSPLDQAKSYNRRRPITPGALQIVSDSAPLSLPPFSVQSHIQDKRFTQSAGPIAPSTPTGSRGLFPAIRGRRSSITPITSFTTELDDCLAERFRKVELIGTGQFSQVYRVSEISPSSDNASGSRNFFSDQSQTSSFRTTSCSQSMEKVFAVKKSRKPYNGQRDRALKLQEVTLLRRLSHSDHVVNFVDSWEKHNHLYIQTEYCEEGSLDLFLAGVGRKARLDDFRTWKVLLELSLVRIQSFNPFKLHRLIYLQGIAHVHDAGIIHLDLKPANVLITFEGVLKIADFGMATSWPAAPGIEGEGDREYIGPEILQGKYDKPADIFALGMIMVEIAGNVELPDNGPSWQKLRAGDLSDVPSLTWSSESGLVRDASGIPISDDSSAWSHSGLGGSQLNSASMVNLSEPDYLNMKEMPTNNLARGGEAPSPPAFIASADDEGSLTNIVRWMISPNPGHRPRAATLLECKGLRWTEKRRRAGATVFEGNWGPADHIVEDVDMLDA